MQKEQFKVGRRPNVRPETLKLIEENKTKILLGIGLGKDFLKRTPRAQEIIPRIHK